MMDKSLVIGLSHKISDFLKGDGLNAVLRTVQARPKRFKVYEKAETLRISVQDVKNIEGTKAAMESVIGVPA